MLKFNNELYSFSDFLELSEAFNPRQTPYGTDGHNLKFKFDGVSYTTRLDVNGTSFIIMFDKSKVPGTYEVGFAQLKSDKHNKDIWSPDNYTMVDQISVGNFFDLFSKILYVILEKSKELPALNTIKFVGGYDRITRFYGILLNNKSFVDLLKSHGFEIDEKQIIKYRQSIFIIRKIHV